MPPLPDGGRIQDGTDAVGNENHIVQELLANGKDSIPFLIDQLDNETEINRHIVPFWYRVYVDDLALIVLNDFFTDQTELKSTVPGFDWDEFLERGKDKDSTSEEIFRRYIQKHGRRNIKERWQRMWEQNKDNIYWDNNCSCFNLKK